MSDPAATVPEPPAAPATDTGAVSLSVLLSLMNITTTPDQLRRDAGAGAGWLDAIDVQRLAKRLGLKAGERRCAWDRLAGAPLPAQVIARDGGFALLAKANGEKVLIHDPLLGRPVQLSRAEFTARFTDRLIFVVRRAGLADEQRPFGLSWFLPPLVRHRALLGNIVLASLLLQIFALATPLFVMVVTDKVLAAGQVATLDVLVVGLILTAVFEWIIGAVRASLSAHTANRLDAELAASMFRHLAALPVAFFSARPVGSLAARLKDLDAIRLFLTGSAATLLVDLAFTLVFLAVMVSYSLPLTLVVLAVVVGILLLQGVIMPVLRARLQKNAKVQTESQSFLVEAVSGMETVKSLAIEPLLQRKWEDQVAAQIHTAHRAERLSNQINQAVAMLNRLMVAIVLWLGAREVIGGTMTAGQMMAFYMLSGRVLAPAQRLAQLAQQWNQARVSIGRVGEVMNAQAEPRRLDGAGLPPLTGNVAFEDVRFRYGDGPEVLRGISFAVEPGQVIGIVGSSGSGKSTLAKLIQRLHLPSQGKVRLDGVDTALIDPAVLRAQIGMVLQDNFLFDLSVRDNIAIAAPGLTPEQVVTAAQLAGAHDFILSLPQAYDTRLGERGAILSAGQRQRLALARALATDPRVLILDEATSALDYESERRIHDNMKRITAGRTVFIIAHRLAILRDCDRILVIENGQVVEDGPPRRLLGDNGRYAQLHRYQLEPVAAQ